VQVARVERYGPGEEAGNFSPGDFILAHRHNFLAGLISQAEKRRFRRAEVVFAHWSHAAIVVGTDGSLVEPEVMGVIRSPISRYRDDEYHLVRLGPEFQPEGRERAVAYALKQVGQAFGFLAMLGASVYLVFGRPLRLMRRNHQTCSGLVVNALHEGGMLSDLDPLLTLPADLAKAFDVRP
jgi:uncharacterized protein YycO